jgi:hypothetical protein
MSSKCGTMNTAMNIASALPTAAPVSRSNARCVDAPRLGSEERAGQHDRMNALPGHDVVEHVADENSDRCLQRKAHEDRRPIASVDPTMNIRPTSRVSTTFDCVT